MTAQAFFNDKALKTRHFGQLDKAVECVALFNAPVPSNSGSGVRRKTRRTLHLGCFSSWPTSSVGRA